MYAAVVLLEAHSLWALPLVLPIHSPILFPTPFFLSSVLQIYVPFASINEDYCCPGIVYLPSTTEEGRIAMVPNGTVNNFVFSLVVPDEEEGRLWVQTDDLAKEPLAGVEYVRDEDEDGNTRHLYDMVCAPCVW